VASDAQADIDIGGGQVNFTYRPTRPDACGVGDDTADAWGVFGCTSTPTEAVANIRPLVKRSRRSRGE
jgi:hypothetical protein